MAEDYTPVFRNRLETESNSRISQIGICFANAFHMFFQHRSWMVLPMTAVLSLIAGLAIREDFFETMEATMTGAFVLVGVCIWNGSFSSIQTICRERNVIREKFRLRLHSSSYTIANMLFQLLVCLTETGIMLVMLWAAGIRYTVPPLITPWFALDFGITLFLVIYASDMVALFVSALCRTKTAAMTILPFILVLQLVFSGSIISIPDSIDPIAMITVSRPGFKAMASQADLNKLPLGMVESILTEMEDVDLHAHITLGQVLELLGDSSNPAVAVVAPDGKVTGIGPGQAVVNCITNDGHKVDATTVTVGTAVAPGAPAPTVPAAPVAPVIATETRSPLLCYQTVQTILGATPNATVVVPALQPMAYDVNVAAALNMRPDVTLAATFPYQGHQFRMTLPKGYPLAAQCDKTGYVEWLQLCALNNGVVVQMLN